ncbi:MULTISPECIES: hypothetical protein [unclassified Shewanella]|uniref:hypothetical protein n=1 Tax=unclassified Shewanella TaxID=196818 RepID=UPI000C821B1A|nr:MULTISPECIES: hypothetical protein [unclassified Shewanella]MDO6619974.1 hypothetical protein [Shewanella sp. 6_MG-2023]MDO6639541.1 hypothetical protein [Shewanella sp. 5_MG-2023]MDO6678009.1 hypothetical protein [Shewanella sp. 4_MG-2023]MDO6775147.1 hypothetical protein [Shewanella sp. 3_MG-2023]PMG30519.1 hypothetical protein BCU94_10990 [Shewanella sp. 10N.286.52.C2]
MFRLLNSKIIKACAIVCLCIIAIVASVQTTGLTRAVIELLAFSGLIALALAKPDIQQEQSEVIKQQNNQQDL